jgi:hypothetical protein
MEREERQLESAGCSEGNSAITFGEIVDSQAWRNTFTNKVDTANNEKAGTIEVPGLTARASASGAQFDRASFDSAAANSAAGSDGGTKKDGETKPADDAAIKQLVSDLSSASFVTRSKATKELEALGTKALPYLKEAVNSPDQETKRRAQGIVDSAINKYAEPRSLDESQYPQNRVGEKNNHRPEMLKKEWTPEQAKERSEALRALAQFKNDTGYGSFESSRLEKQADEWNDMKGTLGRVTALRLAGAHVTDDAIANIKNLPNLKSLDLSNTGVTDKSLESLKDLGRLRSLHLDHTAITDKGLEHLKNCKNLEQLDVGETKITDKGIAALKDLKRLEELGLSNTKLTDKSLDSLKDLPLLKTLDTRDTGITDEGLKKSLPRVKQPTYY